MSLEIRHCTPEEIRLFAEVVSYVFAESPEDYERFVVGGQADLPPEWTMGGFVDGKIVASLAAYPWQVRVNGRQVPTAAVTRVGTYPERRRQGLLRQVMTRALEWHRDSGQAMAMLWASYGAIYQRFGYGLGSFHTEYRFDPRDAGLRDPFEAPGRVERLELAEARPIIERLYAEYAAPRNLLNDRDEWWWERLWRRERLKKRRYQAIYRDAAGEPRGYMVYDTAEDMDVPFQPGPNQSFDVTNFAALTLEAHRALWEFIRAHDLTKEVRFRFAPEDDSIVDMLLEPRALQRRTGDGMWVRIVDVAQALEARGYDEEGAVTLRVTDDVCPWNPGTYRLETAAGEARARRVEGPADLVLPVAALASLYTGFRSATHLARAGRIDGSPEALSEADRLFATRYRPMVMEGF